MDIKNRVKEMDALVSQGDIVNAVKSFFAENASTSDYGTVTTSNKLQMVGKMEGFLNAIKNVNGITHHHSIVDGNVSASEFTFNFDMKDGSKIYWHEIIRRIWNEEGKVVGETYFNAQ
ncbi:hypothetical protein [uncultured Roseivirga sp.]|jgi:cbb3-type cytochrome oxidase subunit 1|uniref:hypothetical protein n=1 Tax=uncultured Roseivirga sp. TaxID=543088 RepID=UPI0030D7173E|tara:strand:- start:51382 stop:51735 length:354 start_codon:yes stop_codon:yes gene_type:complete